MCSSISSTRYLLCSHLHRNCVTMLPKLEWMRKIHLMFLPQSRNSLIASMERAVAPKVFNSFIISFFTSPIHKFNFLQFSTRNSCSCTLISVGTFTPKKEAQVKEEIFSKLHSKFKLFQRT